MRKVLVTGASSDIGLAVCRQYLEQGWQVIGHFRNHRPELDKLHGRNFLGWQCDFSDQSGFEKSLKEKENDLRNVDALVTLAAEIVPKDLLSITTEDILQAILVNYIPSFRLMQIVGSAMLERKFGRIVHGSSIGVKFGGGKQNFPYSLSKHALELIPSESLAWAENNVLVNAARIGVTDTRLLLAVKKEEIPDRIYKIPAKRLATTEEIASSLYWLGSETNSYITGQIIPISGGE
jgi:3-oxoacyl-[acyl-carrier protein] reductase